MVGRTVSLLALLGIFATACGGSVGETPNGGIVEQLVEAQRLYAVAVPAYNDYLEECLISEGFELHRRADEAGPAQDVSNSDIAYAIEIASLASLEDGVEGYGFVDVYVERLVIIETALAQERDTAVTPEYIAAYSGDFGDAEDDGCLGEALERFPAVKGFNDLSALFDSHVGEISAQISAEPEFAAWQQCMSESGYPIASASDLFGQIRMVLDDGTEDGLLIIEDIRSTDSGYVGSGASQAVLSAAYSFEQELAQADSECDSDGVLRVVSAELLRTIGDHLETDH